MRNLSTVLAGAVLGLVFSLQLYAAPITLSVPPAPPDSIVQITAEAQGLELVPPAEVPPFGTFWLVEPGYACPAPLPCPPLDSNLPIYAIADGQFLVDGTGGTVAVNTSRFGLQTASRTMVSALAAQADGVVNLINQVQDAQFNREFAMAFGLDAETDSPGTFSPLFAEFDTNGLWLEITNVANGWAYLNLHNATNQVYAIETTTNLLTSWQVEKELWPTTDQTNVLPFTLPMLGRQNLFVRAEDWTGVTENGNTVPDWWFWEYFGTTALSDTNFAGTGNTLLSYYQNGIDPNTIQFSLQFTNDYYTSSPIGGTINIQGGEPFYEAVLVNDSNPANAVWQPFASTNLAVDLSSGFCTIYVGLRGLPANAQQTWQQVQLTLNVTPLTLMVTNPSSSTVSQPTIQVQGYASKPLSSLAYDISNAAGIFTNQTGYVTGQFYNTNLQMFTTNYFQCYDIPLANGLNAITLQATDLTGNTTTASFNFTLDYSSGTMPQALNLVWPQDGTYISGGSFNVQAQVGVNTASVTAQIADASGKTSTVQGLVERNGNVWVNNLPLAAGTNILTVTVTDAAGNSTTTNLTLIQSAVMVTMNPLASDQLNQSSVMVTGTVSEPGYDVWVNGVQATNNGDGTWAANSVPVSPVGMAMFDVEIYVGDPVLAGQQFFNQDQPPIVVLSDFKQNSDSGGQYSIIKWNYAGGGSWNWGGWCNFTSGGSLPPDGSSYAQPVVTLDFGDPSFLTLGMLLSFGETFAPTWQNAKASYYNGNTFQTSVQTTVMIVPSGSKLPGLMKFYLVGASAEQFDPLIGFPPDQDYTFFFPLFRDYNCGNVSVPPEQLLINGQPLVGSVTNYVAPFWIQRIWGQTIISAPAGALVPLTMTTTNATNNDYSFDVQVNEILPPLVDNNHDGQITFDTSDATTPTNPFRFWINDSQESGDVLSDGKDSIPGYGSPNYARNQINGRSDLVNFFPAALCLSNILQWLPVTNGFEYHLAQADRAVKFVYTSLTNANAFDYLTNTASYGYGTNANEWVTNADAIQILASGASGTKLDTNWLAMVQTNNGNGVILLEGCAATTKPLMLEIWRTNTTTHQLEKMGGVEQMYRWVNLRHVVGANESRATDASEPANNPDNLSNGKNFVFVHGYSVSESAARGWNAEMFKRLYQSHSHAMFTGVTWFGNEGQLASWVPFYGGDTPDYYTNVANAFLTASNLAVVVNALPGQKYIAAHSLGNMVISSAIADWGLNANTYFMIDAAVAMEAYNASTSDNPNLVPPPYWLNYSNRLWASKWYQLFDASDARSSLTWSNRFGNIPIAYNYYSSTEDVLENADGLTHSITGQAFAWVNQEMLKGSFTVRWWPMAKRAGDSTGLAWMATATTPLTKLIIFPIRSCGQIRSSAILPTPIYTRLAVAQM